MPAGSIVVDLLMRTGSFETDTDRAAKAFDRRMRGMKASASSAVAGINSAFAAIGVGLSAAAFTALVKGAVDAADRLNDLAKQSGVAVETLGGIGFAAQQAGGSLDGVTDALGKLNKNLAAAAAGDKSAAEPFIALGIAVTDAAGRTRNADAVFADVADKFRGYADGPEKAALALRLFGKAGAEQIALLNEGGEALRQNIAYYQRYSGVTTEVAQQADAFNDSLEKIRLLSGAFGNQLAASLLPTLQQLADAFLDAKEKGDGFKGIADGIAAFFREAVILGANVVFVFKAVGTEIGGMAAQIAALARLDFKGFAFIGDQMKADAAAARKEIDAFADRLRNPAPRGTALAAGAAPRLRGTTPPLRGTTDNTSALLKRELDAQLQAIKDHAAGRKQVLDFQARYLASEYQDGLFTLRQFHADERALRAEALDAQLQALDAEIAAQEKYKARAGKPEDRLDAEKRIAAAVAERGRAVVKHQQDAALAALEEGRALEQLQDRYTDLQATILGLQGNDTAANRLRIDQQVRDAERLVAQAGGNPAEVDRYARLLAGQNDLSAAQKQYNTLLAQQRDAEESILLAAQASGATELETLSALGASRQDALAQLSAMVERANALAAALGTPESIQFADQLALALKRATAEADPLLGKIRDLGQEAGQAIADGFGEALVNGGSLRDMLKGIEQDLLRITTRELVTKPLGQLFGNAIGGNGQQSGAGGLLGALAGLFGAGAGGGSSGAFGIGVSGYATGGSPPVGVPALVGEMGPELFVPRTAGTVLPAQQTARLLGAKAGNTYHLSVQAPAGGSKQSASQWAAEALRVLRSGTRNS